MVWACSPLGLWLSKTKQQDTQCAASQLCLTPWPGPRPSLPCHVSGLLPLTLLTILFFLAWARSSEKLFLLHPYSLHVSNACVTQGTANTVPAVPCPWYQRGCCQRDTLKYSQPGVTLITYLFIRALGERGTCLQVSSRGQEALMVWACSPLGLWLSKTKQQDTQSVA